MNKWISIKDKLPLEGQKVLIYKDPLFGPEMVVDNIIWRNDSLPKNPEPIKDYLWYCQLEVDTSKVSHWMELPEKPL